MTRVAIPQRQVAAPKRRIAVPRRRLAIPQHVLLAGGAFGPGLDAERVLAAIARGLQAGGRPDPDLCPLDGDSEKPADARLALDVLDFDSRMRTARAVVIADPHLQESTLAGSVTFEIATRARQGGVPAYAVTANNELNAFDARVLDLQLVLQARTPTALANAGRKLAQVL